MSGRFHYSAEDRSMYPTVGDWVAFRSYDNFAYIEAVLPRQSAFSRNRAGKETGEQVVASNIDYVCIVCGLDGGRNFNLRGIERYIAMVRQGGSTPVIVLNKADLCQDRDGALLSAQSIVTDGRVHLVSALTKEGIDAFSESFEEGTTVAFAGHSGVGKSSLINCLVQMDTLKTQLVRKSDLRGRHTTTHKELFFLKSGAMVIDTPGMRELQLWGSEDCLDETYSEIARAATRCRFGDCTHQNEPGCAVQEMLIDGSLPVERYENYLQMRSEIQYTKKQVHERRADGKQFSKMVKRMKKVKGVK